MDNRYSPMSLSSRQWFALHVCSRHEKVVDRLLLEKGFETFLPLMVKRSRVSLGRFREANIPLFPGYVFSCFYPSAEDYYQVRATTGVVNIVQTNARPAPIPDGEIESLKKLLAITVEYRISPSFVPSFVPGQTVIIKEGPLKGIRGEILRRKNRRLFVIRIALIRRMLEVDLSPLDLEGCF